MSTLNIENLVEAKELDRKKMAEIEGGFMILPFTMAAKSLYDRYTIGPTATDLPSGSTYYSYGGGEIVGIEDARTQTSYAL